ncbi:MAG TPA: TIGR03435 family protein [Bryobacteraceae bacterium]|nr:TIGR03435 family protein [Bryobacteraceae bacterium]
MGALIACEAVAQSPAEAPLPAFDVASLKAAPPPSGRYRINMGSVEHGTVTFENATLSECLRYVFRISTDEQIAGPDWMKQRDIVFNMTAKAPPETPSAQIRLMVLQLLTERFQLKIHHEQRELHYLALMPDKGGIKLREVNAGEESKAGTQFRAGAIELHRISMIALAVALSNLTGEAVVDKTGIKGSAIPRATRRRRPLSRRFGSNWGWCCRVRRAQWG